MNPTPTPDLLYGLNSDESLQSSAVSPEAGLQASILDLVIEEAVAEGIPTKYVLPRWAWPVTIHEFKRRTIPSPTRERLAKILLENLLEELDSDYGIEAHTTKPTDDTLGAARQFVKAVLCQYSVRACVPTGRRFQFTLEDAIRILSTKQK